MSAQVGIKSMCLRLIGIDINYSKQCYVYAPSTPTNTHNMLTHTQAALWHLIVKLRASQQADH